MPKAISLDVRYGAAGLVVAVTFPTPWSTMKTVDVAISDDAARRLIAKVESLLNARTRRLSDGKT
jgi:hypothetical protein